jgi:hypothetical protein
MPTKAEKKPAAKAPSTKAPVESKDFARKVPTAAVESKKKRKKHRTETYSRYIYKGNRPESEGGMFFAIEMSLTVVTHFLYHFLLFLFLSIL